MVKIDKDWLFKKLGFYHQMVFQAERMFLRWHKMACIR